jgi:hypothetical protein
MDVLFGISAFALGLGALVTWMWSRGEGWRWGSRPGPVVEVGDGAYRTAAVSTRTPRRMPAVCAIASATSVAWGTITLCLFAPAGILGWTVAASAVGRGLHGVPGILGVLGFLGLLAVTIHGFLIGPCLIGLVSPLTVRTSTSSLTVARAATRSLAHHLFVIVSCALLGLGMDTPIWPAVAAPPVLVGAAHAILLTRARVTLDRLDRLDRDDAATDPRHKCPEITAADETPT